MIPILGFMNLYNKIILNLKLVHYQSTTTHTCVLGHNSHKTRPFSSKIRASFVENGKVELGNYP